MPASVSLALAAPRARSYGRRSYGRSKSYGRSRSYSRGANYYRQRASRRRAYIAGRYPKAQWAHPWVERGTQQAAALGIGEAGTTFAQATPSQQARRKQIGWYGQGDYGARSYGPAGGAGAGTALMSFTGQALDGTVLNLAKNKQMIRSEVFFNVLSPLTIGQQSIQEFTVNLGLDEMFPFGSQIANNYRKYKITQLAFQYKNMLAQSLTTVQVGQVTLQWNPDVNEENDTTTNMQALNDQGSVTVNANEDATIFCEADPSRGAAVGFLNVRNKDLRATQDANDFDFGKLVVTLQGFPLANVLIGRLSVMYCVELSHEIINTSMGNSIDTDLFVRPSSAPPDSGIPPTVTPVAVTLTSSNLVSLSSILASENNVGCVLYAPTSLSGFGIQWPSTAFGYYEIKLMVETPPTIAAQTPTIEATGNNQGTNAPVVFVSNNTVGPVFDMLNTSAGPYYGGLTQFSQPCLAPTGNSIVPPGDPYVFANAVFSYAQISTSQAPPFAIGLVARYEMIIHVYVPGAGSNTTPPLPGAPGRSPICLNLGVNQLSAYMSMTAAAVTQQLLAISKWTLSVTEYNATMRLKLNGTQDTPYLLNQGLVPTIPTASSWGP